MKFKAKWTSEQIDAMREVVAQAPNHDEGCRRAADLFDTTMPAVKGLMRRTGKPTAQTAPKPAQPKEARMYEDELARRAEATRIRKLEKDEYELRQIVAAMDAITSKPLAPVQRYELSSGRREACAVALFSDVHCEEIVHVGETPTGNEYNPTIADTSIRRFFSGYRWLIEKHRSMFDIRTAMLWLGGDLITGHIHPENVETTAGTPIETVDWLRPRLVAGIDLLLETPGLDSLRVPCSYGNHGRNTMKPYRARGAAHSYEWLLYQFLADHYADNPRVQFLADKSAHQYAKVYDFDLHFHHGDEISYGGGVGGITIPINKKVAQWDRARRCDFHNFGHFHQYMDTGHVAMNGSVIGYNAYAMSIGASFEVPQQAFYLLDSKRGKTAKCPIWVRE